MSNPEQASCKRAKEIIRVAGGVEAVCNITGRSKTWVYSWAYPKVRHGTGGLIPPECQQALIAYSRENDLGLMPEDFFPPEPEKSECASVVADRDAA